MEKAKQYLFLLEGEIDKIGEINGYADLTALRLAIEDLRLAIDEYEQKSQGRGV
jgi:hypothetical protein